MQLRQQRKLLTSRHRGLNPIQDGLFRVCSQMGGRRAKKTPLHKTCHTYPAMMKFGTVIPYPKKIQKIYESRDIPLGFC